MIVSLRSVVAASLAVWFAAAAAFAQTPANSPAATPADMQAAVAATATPVPKPKATPVPDTGWLSVEEIKAIIASVPPPPAAGSPGDQADLKTEVDVQNARTPERSDQAKKDASLAMGLFLHDVDPAVNPKSDPKFNFLFQQIHREEDAVNGGAKGRFQRPRPFVAHGDVIHPLGTIGGSSYPSGHATCAFCHAVILGQIFPEHAAQFLDIAKRLADSRVVMGVHYTADIKEGERDGREIARELLTKPEFLARLAEVKAEIAQPAPSPAH